MFKLSFSKILVARLVKSVDIDGVLDQPRGIIMLLSQLSKQVLLAYLAIGLWSDCLPRFMFKRSRFKHLHRCSIG